MVRRALELDGADRRRVGGSRVNLAHRHDQMYEIYLVARGESVAVVAGQTIPLGAGDMLVVEPGEAHTFIASSDDYLHFVVQAHFVKGDKVDLD